MRRSLAASQVTFINDVIVKQGGGVNKFNRCRQADMTKALVAANLRSRECEHGPEALAAGVDNMSRQLRDQRNITPHPLQNQRVHVLKVVFNQAKQALNSALWFGSALG